MIDLIFGFAYFIVIMLGVCIGLAAVVATYFVWRAVRAFQNLKEGTEIKESFANDGY